MVCICRTMISSPISNGFTNTPKRRGEAGEAAVVAGSKIEITVPGTHGCCLPPCLTLHYIYCSPNSTRAVPMDQLFSAVEGSLSFPKVQHHLADSEYGTQNADTGSKRSRPLGTGRLAVSTTRSATVVSCGRGFPRAG